MQCAAKQLKQEKKKEKFNAKNLVKYAKDWKDKCKEKETNHSKLNKEHQTLKNNKDLRNFMKLHKEIVRKRSKSTKEVGSKS